MLLAREAREDIAYNHIGGALSKYQTSRIFYPFTSKYDRHLKGTATLLRPPRRGRHRAARAMMGAPVDRVEPKLYLAVILSCL